MAEHARREMLHVFRNDVVAAAEQRVGPGAAWISAMAARVLAPRLSSGVFRVAAQMEAMYARTSLEQ